MTAWHDFLRRIGRGRAKEGDILPAAIAHTSEDRAQHIASQAAADQDYPWRSPVSAQLISDEGRARWFVRCNAGQRGSGMLVVIDDETGDVVRTQTQPR